MSKCGIHKGPLEIVSWMSHARNPEQVALKYQHMIDGSRLALTPGKGETARHLRQIAAGSLRVENGLVA